MNTKKVLKLLEGSYTVESVMDAMDIDCQQAVYYIHRLRKEGYVKTKRLPNNQRLYHISFANKVGGIGYYDIINAQSPVKLSPPIIYKIHGKQPSNEETMLYAIKTGSLRTILAALALFKRIKDWTKLYQLSKKERLERQIGALYDLSRKIMRTKRMSRRFRNNALPKKGDSFEYVLFGLKSKDFKSIENIWKVYLPFNQADLEAYR